MWWSLSGSLDCPQIVPQNRFSLNFSFSSQNLSKTLKKSWKKWKKWNLAWNQWFFAPKTVKYPIPILECLFDWIGEVPWMMIQIFLNFTFSAQNLSKRLQNSWKSWKNSKLAWNRWFCAQKMAKYEISILDWFMRGFSLS